MMALGGGAAGAGGRAVARSERYADVSEEVMDHLRHRGGGSSSYSASSSRAAAALRQQELAGADNQSQMITGKITSSAAQPSSRRGSSRVVPMHAIEKSKYVDPSLLGEDPRVLTDSTRSRGTTSSSSSRSRGGAAVVPGTNAATSSSSAGPGGAANGNNYDPARGGGGGGSHQMVPTVQRTPNAQRERLREAEHLAIFETAKHLSGGRTELRSPFSGWQRNLVGLRNLGNTCFLNSSIQCLLSIPQLQTYFRERFSEADLNERTAPLKGKLAREFSALLEEVRGSSSSRSAVLSPASLRNLIIRYAPQFSGYSQQDSHEALRFLLDGLHEDLNRVKSKPKYCEMKDIKGESVDDAALRWWRYSMSHGDSPINDIFGGQLLSETRCGMCGHKSWTFDVFLDLSLPIPARPGGMDAPVMVGPADYHCEACKARKGLTKRLTIYKPPRVLVVHLKRFSHSRFSREKLNTLVRFPTTNLDLSEYVEASNSVPVYDLAAVSQHSGSMGGGHYTAACRVNSNEWANISDSHVSATSERHIEDRSAYVLFYVRRKAPGGGNQLEYKIVLQKGSFAWTVRRRYADFESVWQRLKLADDDFPGREPLWQRWLGTNHMRARFFDERTKDLRRCAEVLLGGKWEDEQAVQMLFQIGNFPKPSPPETIELDASASDSAGEPDTVVVEAVPMSASGQQPSSPQSQSTLSSRRRHLRIDLAKSSSDDIFPGASTSSDVGGDLDLVRSDPSLASAFAGGRGGINYTKGKKAAKEKLLLQLLIRIRKPLRRSARARGD
eukprot:g1263.t1